MTTSLEKITDFATSLQLNDIPSEVRQEAGRMLLDSIGCGIGALNTQRAQSALRTARSLSGPGTASVLGTDDRLSLQAAAFANGELITTLDYDALISPPGHIAPYVIPALLAVAEDRNSTGAELVHATVLAHELGARFGAALSDVRSVAKGEKITFPAVSGYSCSLFGGTLGAGMLEGLSRDQLVDAMGIVGLIAPVHSMGKWVRTLPATASKYVMAGWMNQAQLLSITLAKEGYDGDASVLDGDFGFWRYIGSNRWVPEALTDRLGSWWRFPQSAIYKPYAHCRISQTVLDCLADLRDTHALKPSEIEKIETYCDPHGAMLPMWATKDIRTVLDAQMSVPFAVSLVAHNVANGPIWQDEETMRNSDYLAFMDKVTVAAHPDFEDTIREEPGSRIGRVVVHARGTTFVQERKYRKGSPATAQTRMSDAELVDKFRVNCERHLPSAKIEELAQALLSLEDIGAMRDVARLWQPGS